MTIIYADSKNRWIEIFRKKSFWVTYVIYICVALFLISGEGIPLSFPMDYISFMIMGFTHILIIFTLIWAIKKLFIKKEKA